MWCVPRFASPGLADNWTELVAESAISLAPRGFGRSSYHVAEIIQLGRLPLVVYSAGKGKFHTHAWLPYKGTRADVTLVAAFDEHHQKGCNCTMVSEELGAALAATDDDIVRREARILEVRASHYSYQGVILQIKAFLAVGPASSDLRCDTVGRALRW